MEKLSLGKYGQSVQSFDPVEAGRLKAESFNKQQGDLTGYDCHKCLNRGRIAIVRVPIKGTQARSTFATKKQREAYMNLYCYGEYRSCPLLQAVLCPYNEGVECREKDHCDHCGWNPRIGSMRLEKWKEKQFASDGSEKANKGQTKR